MPDLVMFASTCSLVWSSPAIPKLKSTNLEINPLGFPITPFQESWIAALPSLGATVGPLLSGKFADVYGRKNMLMVLAILEIISYIILSFATNIYIYYLARFLLGIGVGICFAVLPLFIGEISEDHNRGKLGCTMGIFATLGVLYTLSIAPLLSLKIFTLSCTVPLIFVLISFILVIPETPIYLASIGDKENAVKSLRKLRNENKKVAEKDLQEILKIIEESSSSSEGFIEIFKMTALRKGLIICAGLCFFSTIFRRYCNFGIYRPYF
ncbi:hypothetical protein NQ314_011441 [Rhamnusium bicolor]|uniref:Major facilitator superfamily (MFS) profile domain-containing protein n=1 Tax=Rhamnusium bicolor TaxID=1586634 RepID=A0AAV8XJ45_9CUCU|nr:hypothetical protein NQ314_011441 [Rhamnusium bicolor]